MTENNVNPERNAPLPPPIALTKPSRKAPVPHGLSVTDGTVSLAFGSVTKTAVYTAKLKEESTYAIDRKALPFAYRILDFFGTLFSRFVSRTDVVADLEHTLREAEGKYEVTGKALAELGLNPNTNSLAFDDAVDHYTVSPSALLTIQETLEMDLAKLRGQLDAIATHDVAEKTPALKRALEIEDKLTKRLEYVRSWRQVVAANSDEYNTHAAKKAELEPQIADLKSRLAANPLAHKIIEQRRVVADLKTKFEHAETEAQKRLPYLSRIHAIPGEIDALEEDLRQIQGSKATIQEQKFADEMIETLTLNVEKAEQRLLVVEKELTVAEKKMQSFIGLRGDENAPKTLEREIGLLYSQIINLTEEKKQLSRKIDKLGNSIKKFRKKSTNVQTKAAETIRKHEASVIQKIARLKKELEECQRELKTLGDVLEVEAKQTLTQLHEANTVLAGLMTEAKAAYGEEGVVAAVETAEVQLAHLAKLERDHGAATVSMATSEDRRIPYFSSTAELMKKLAEASPAEYPIVMMQAINDVYIDEMRGELVPEKLVSLRALMSQPGLAHRFERAGLSHARAMDLSKRVSRSLKRNTLFKQVRSQFEHKFNNLLKNAVESDFADITAFGWLLERYDELTKETDPAKRAIGEMAQAERFFALYDIRKEGLYNLYTKHTMPIEKRYGQWKQAVHTHLGKSVDEKVLREEFLRTEAAILQTVHSQRELVIERLSDDQRVLISGELSKTKELLVQKKVALDAEISYMTNELAPLLEHRAELIEEIETGKVREEELSKDMLNMEMFLRRRRVTRDKAIRLRNKYGERSREFNEVATPEAVERVRDRLDSITHSWKSECRYVDALEKQLEVMDPLFQKAKTLIATAREKARSLEEDIGTTAESMMPATRSRLERDVTMQLDRAITRLILEGGPGVEELLDISFENREKGLQAYLIALLPNEQDRARHLHLLAMSKYGVPEGASEHDRFWLELYGKLGAEDTDLTAVDLTALASRIRSTKDRELARSEQAFNAMFSEMFAQSLDLASCKAGAAWRLCVTCNPGKDVVDLAKKFVAHPQFKDKEKHKELIQEIANHPAVLMHLGKIGKLANNKEFFNEALGLTLVQSEWAVESEPARAQAKLIRSRVKNRAMQRLQLKLLHLSKYTTEISGSDHPLMPSLDAGARKRINAYLKLYSALHKGGIAPADLVAFAREVKMSDEGFEAMFVNSLIYSGYENQLSAWETVKTCAGKRDIRSRAAAFVEHLPTPTKKEEPIAMTMPVEALLDRSKQPSLRRANSVSDFRSKKQN